ncbi:hypothetical protein ABFX02_07G065000 [Erythranthe guttata]
MHMKSFCFILPPETDENKLSDRTGCSGGGVLCFNFLRRSLNRFLHSKPPRRLLCFCRRRESPEKRFSVIFFDAEGVQVAEKFNGENPRIFSYSELYIGSNGFHDGELLGSGGFGRVYRAVLPSDGTAVAVKCLAERGDTFQKTFTAELVAVAHLRHRNLVRLRGWCVHDGLLLLVYDYMPHRSLDRVLFRRPENPLTWERRKRIVAGLATALHYLHEQLETQIIHRDVKTSNVMLDSNFEPKLGDFGLARWLEHDLDPSYEPKTPPVSTNSRFRLAETTGIGGTIGYLPPESFQKRKTATAKSDVFSFGIVVLEIISGRRAVDLTYPDDRIILLDWIRRLSDEGNLLEAGDSRLLDGSYELSDMEKIIRLGLMCTLHDPQSRPSMKCVLELLSGDVHGELPKLPSFRSHPLYISLSSTTTTNTMTTTTKANSNSSGVVSISTTSSNFVTANAETLYLTADESERSKGVSVFSTSRNDKRTFVDVETPRAITYDEIVSVTDNFSDSRRVAEVDFGTAYHGFLEGGRRHVIVKRLGMKTCPALRKRFADEFRNLGRLRHRNLLQLCGWCTEQGEMLVVYDYSTSRHLSRVLFHNHHRKEKNWKSELSWRQRYNIVRSLACAIRYLHEEWEEQVVHRNITSSAVILDQDSSPRLGSFALAEFLTRNEDGQHVSPVDKKKSVRGIFGYMSPEYIDSGDASTMADVYSFGVVLLEVVTGQVAVDFSQREVLLVKRVRELVEERKRGYEELVDWRLDGEFEGKELERVVKLGIACTRSDPELRPSMRQIVSVMDGHDRWLVEMESKKESGDEWRTRNRACMCMVRRMQALGIH